MWVDDAIDAVKENLLTEVMSDLIDRDHEKI